MSWYTREQFEAKKPIAADTAPPANGSTLFQAIVRRQVISLDWLKVPLRFYSLSAFGPAAAGQAGRSIATGRRSPASSTATRCGSSG